MSTKDVQILEALFKKTVENMTAGGVRMDPSSANNAEIRKYRFTLGRAGHDFSSCGEQADQLQRLFEGMEDQLDDDWTFESAVGVFPNPTDDRFPVHRWFEGRSSNPTDDVVVVDPWSNKFEHHPLPATTPTPFSNADSDRSPLGKLPGYPHEKHQTGPGRCTCGMTHPTEHAPWDADCAKAPPCWCEDERHCGIGQSR